MLLDQHDYYFRESYLVIRNMQQIFKCVPVTLCLVTLMYSLHDLHL